MQAALWRSWSKVWSQCLRSADSQTSAVSAGWLIGPFCFFQSSSPFLRVLHSTPCLRFRSDGNIAVSHNLWLHFGVDEHPFATHFDVHQGYRVICGAFSGWFKRHANQPPLTRSWSEPIGQNWDRVFDSDPPLEAFLNESLYVWDQPGAGGLILHESGCVSVFEGTFRLFFPPVHRL